MELSVIKLNKLYAYVGVLLKDMELRYSQNDIPFLSFSVACETENIDLETNRPISEFIQIVLFSGAAMYFSNLRKFDVLEIKGVVKARNYYRDNGQNAISYEIRKPIINVSADVRFRLDRKMEKKLNESALPTSYEQSLYTQQPQQVPHPPQQVPHPPQQVPHPPQQVPTSNKIENEVDEDLYPF